MVYELFSGKNATTAVDNLGLFDTCQVNNYCHQLICVITTHVYIKNIY